MGRIKKSQDHFAVFPDELVNKCILAGTAEQACGVCGAPYVREVEKEFIQSGPTRNRGKVKGGQEKIAKSMTMGDGGKIGSYDVKTIGFRPSCEHTDKTGKCIVLDPFSGTNTVGYRAQEMGRDWIAIELNDNYIKMGQRKTAQKVLL